MQSVLMRLRVLDLLKCNLVEVSPAYRDNCTQKLQARQYFQKHTIHITPEKYPASVQRQEESERATENTRSSRDGRVLLCDRDWAAARMPNLPAPPKIFPCNLASLTSIKRPNLGPQDGRLAAVGVWCCLREGWPHDG